MDDTVAALGRLARSRPRRLAFSEGEGAGVSHDRLFRMVCALTDEYRALPDVVGLIAPGGIAWVAANLALMAAGRTVVPLPDFFSGAQLAHIVRDAGIALILATPETRAQAEGLGVPVCDIALPEPDEAALLPAVPDSDKAGQLVIYTSGSTGRPKGVRIGAAQLAHSARALAEATAAAAGDVYLSVLPISLLLEQICAIHVPLRTGVRVVFGGPAAMRDLAGLVDRIRPTLMVLVPQLLSVWTAALESAAAVAPASLRFVAVGGAAVPAALAEAAWHVGIPVHEGYGLSECCSVVALNRPGERKAGTVGRPLGGIGVTLEDGEIVVRGPTVTDGYVNQPGDPPVGLWRTGDLGALDAGGRLTVLGRKDSMLVTPAGRNVVPEWIEAMVCADARLAHCVLTIDGRGELTAILVPRDGFVAAFQAMSETRLARHVADLVAAAPAYARPTRCTVLPEAECVRNGWLTGNGRLRRHAIAAAFATTEKYPQPASLPVP